MDFVYGSGLFSDVQLASAIDHTPCGIWAHVLFGGNVDIGVCIASAISSRLEGRVKFNTKYVDICTAIKDSDDRRRI